MTPREASAGSSGPAGSGRAMERALWAALVALVAVPAVAVLAGVGDGRVLFLDYREPKLVAVLLLGTLFLALFVWTRGVARSARILSESLGESRDLAVLAGLTGVMALSGLWAKVPENWWYELRQTSLLLVVVLLLRWWARREPRIADLIVTSLCGSVALLVLVGALQAMGAVPWLVAIDPGYGVVYPSLLGYKNPMALAVIGQIFLLPLAAEAVLRRVHGARTRRLVVALAALLFGAECVYVAFLESRTSYLALTLGLLAAGAVLATSGRSREGLRKGLRPTTLAAILLAALAVLAAPFALHDGLRVRLVSVKTDYVDGWSTSDRATYLFNSMEMVRHRPLGVGLGNWQTYYPVYRAHNPEVAFSERVQPRRAHNDHAQLLAELGLPGFALWTVFWGLLLWRLWRPRAHPLGRPLGDLLGKLLGIQALVWGVAMVGDFVLEQPYLELQFFLFLALPAACVSTRGETADAGPEPRPPGGGRIETLRLLLPLLVLAVGWETWHLTARLHHSGLLRYHAARAVEADAADAPPEAVEAAVRRALAAADRFVGGRGHTKNFHKDYLLAAELALVAGRPATSHSLAWTALRLHPYDSQAFALLARIWAPVDPAVSREHLRVHRYILDGPAAGFELPYPERRPFPADGARPGS